MQLRLFILLLFCLPGALFAQIKLQGLEANNSAETYANVVSLDTTGYVKLVTKQVKNDTLVLQQYRWNKWMTVGKYYYSTEREVLNIDAQLPIHTQRNKFRLKWVNDTVKVMTFYVFNSQEQVTFSPWRMGDYLNFSAPTQYEIYDQYGNIVLKGYGDKVKVKKLYKGRYYLNYDNQFGDFIHQ